MIQRELKQIVLTALQHMPAVAILGSRQVGKTTLALEIVKEVEKDAFYLDLELDSDLSKLSDPESYLKRFDNKLVVLDEAQLKPDVFRILRGIIDVRKRKGEKAGQFLILGSASRDLLQQSSETLAGRIRYTELAPFSVKELYTDAPLGFNMDKLWFRGGFPDSYLAISDDESWAWRIDFIATYVERDIPLMGPRVASSRMKRFWTMLAHYHGQQVVFSELGKSLELSHTTIRHYLDILTDFYMVRQIQPWSGNTKKRLVKSPKIYLRDSGILHSLLRISNFESLLGNPALGASWEGFVIENIILQLSSKWRYSYYRTSNQVEIDLILEDPNNEVWAVEVKRSSAPVLSPRFFGACDDVKATKRFVVYGGSDRYPLSGGVEVIGLIEFLQMLKN